MLGRSFQRRSTRSLAALLAMLAVLAAVGSAGPARAVDNPIVTENQQPGDPGWQLSGLVADDTSNQIKGYASATSLNKGDSLTFYVTVNPAQTFTLDVYRLGWYAGVGGRLMQHVGPLNGVQQAACPMDPTTGMVACSWSPSYTLAVPTSWTTGAYVAMLTNAQGYQNEVPFVVRDDSRVGALLYQQSATTYQAYNNWGGKSLYDYNSGNARAHKVSFDRPYAADGNGDLMAWEVYMIHWLEKSGYDVSYSTSLDTHTTGSRLLSYKGFLSVGHDEYYSKEMYDALQAARDAGVGLGFFTANPVYWQVRFEPSASGAANRVMVCYKPAEGGPGSTDPITATSPALTTTRFRDPPVNRPEQVLVGVQFTSVTSNSYDGTVPYVITNSGNWVYAGTGVKDGDSVPGIVGFEADRQFAEYPLPNALGASYTLLSRSPYTSTEARSDYQQASVYQAPGGAWVFATGTMGWNFALDRAGYVDARIQQVTANVLNKFLNSGGTPTPTPTPVTSPYRAAVLADRPTSYWRLGEANGVVAVDQQAATNGTYVNSPALGQPGALAGDPGTSVALNGLNQYVAVPYAPALNTPRFSVEVWAYPTGGANTYRGVVGSRLYPQGWVLYASDRNQWEFWVNSGTGMVAPSGGTVTLNSWSHLVGTFDGTTARLYVNGALVDSSPVTTYTPQGSNQLAIGQAEPGSNFWFPGRLEEAAVYSAALDPSRVLAHYNTGTTGVASATAAPAAAPAAAPEPSPYTVTFQVFPGQDEPLSGQYPSKLIDWGAEGTWYVSGPAGQLGTNSVYLSDAPSGSFRFVAPRRLAQLDAYNRDSSASTVTLTCDGTGDQARATLAAGALSTIRTGWTRPCAGVTIATDGATSFTNLVLQRGG